MNPFKHYMILLQGRSFLKGCENPLRFQLLKIVHKNLWILLSIYCCWKRFLRRLRSTVQNKRIASPLCNLLERCYGRVNNARYAMPRTTFVRVSKNVPATIVLCCSFCIAIINLDSRKSGPMATMVDSPQT